MPFLHSHGDFCLEKDFVDKVKASWLKVLNDEIEYQECVIHGNKVEAYKMDYCGFYLAI